MLYAIIAIAIAVLCACAYGLLMLIVKRIVDGWGM